MLRYKRLWIFLFALGAGGSLICSWPGSATRFPAFDFGLYLEKRSDDELTTYDLNSHKKKWKQTQYLYKTHLMGKKRLKGKERIPKFIHQICLKRKGPSREERARIEKVKQLHPDWRHRLWQKEEIEFLLMENRAEVERAKGPEKIQRIALEILHQHGGVFLDLSYDPRKPLDILAEHCDLIAALGNSLATPEINPRLIGCIPHHPLIEKCLSVEGAFPQTFFKFVKRKGKKANVLIPPLYFPPDVEKIGEESFGTFCQ